MSGINAYKEAFKANYDKFLIGCDAIEESGSWPVEELGQMESYFSNDFACVIIRLIAADGEFHVSEVDFLNDALGFDYNIEELKRIYAESEDKITALFDTGISDSIEKIRKINPKFADHYKKLLEMIGTLVIESDEVVTEEEKARAAELIEALK